MNDFKDKLADAAPPGTNTPWLCTPCGHIHVGPCSKELECACVPQPSATVPAGPEEDQRKKWLYRYKGNGVFEAIAPPASPLAAQDGAQTGGMLNAHELLAENLRLKAKLDILSVSEHQEPYRLVEADHFWCHIHGTSKTPCECFTAFRSGPSVDIEKLAEQIAEAMLAEMLPEPFRTETAAIPGTLRDMAQVAAVLLRQHLTPEPPK